MAAVRLVKIWQDAEANEHKIQEEYKTEHEKVTKIEAELEALSAKVCQTLRPKFPNLS